MNVYVSKTATGQTDKVIVEDDGDVVSSCLVRANPSGKWMKVSRVRTRKQFRGKGYATQVLQKVIEVFGKTELRLSPHPDNTGGLEYEQLRAFYRRFGFCDVDGQKRMVRLPG
jgi:predicted GNAT family N-acyltransferase